MSAFTDESWYEREIVTEELRWLGDELCRRTGRPASAAGDKGNEAHNSGSHRSQEWLLNSRFCDNRSYTVQSGLTATQARHIAGFDFTPGSDTAMVAQCQRLYSALKAGQLEEVREFYGNVNGDRVVDGWNNLENRNASSDSSHLWHWHLSFDRRRMTDRALMERVVAIVMGDDDMDANQSRKLDNVERILTTWSDGRKPYGIKYSASDPGRELPNPFVAIDGQLNDLTARPAVQPAPVDVAALAAALAPHMQAAAEAAVRKVLGGVDGASPAGSVQ